MHDSNCVKSQLSIMTANSRGATTLHLNPVQIRALAPICAGNTNRQIQLSRGATALLTHFHYCDFTILLLILRENTTP